MNAPIRRGMITNLLIVLILFSLTEINIPKTNAGKYTISLTSKSSA
jgi:hypothetical protein